MKTRGRVFIVTGVYEAEEGKKPQDYAMFGKFETCD